VIDYEAIRPKQFTPEEFESACRLAEAVLSASPTWAAADEAERARRIGMHVEFTAYQFAIWDAEEAEHGHPVTMPHPAD
jgi:hypothetical protein